MAKKGKKKSAPPSTDESQWGASPTRQEVLDAISNSVVLAFETPAIRNIIERAITKAVAQHFEAMAARRRNS